MDDKIFDIVDGKVIINLNCLLIPQFKAVIDKYGQEVAQDIFAYIVYDLNPKSPFVDYDDERRETTLMKMYNPKGLFTLEDLEVIAAMDPYKEIRWTVCMEALDGSRAMLHKFSKYLKNAQIIDGQSGNITQIKQIMENMGEFFDNYDHLSKQIEKEQQKTNVRGGKHVSNRER